MSIYKNVINYVETPDGVEKREENVNDILARKENQYKGWKCWSGIYCISISPDGTLHNATCSDKKLGNVFNDDKIELPTEPYVCRRQWCACAADLSLRKIKDDEYEKHLRPIKDED